MTTERKHLIVEKEGLSMNVVKTIGIVLAGGKKEESARVDPSSVCEEKVVCNSVKCASYLQFLDPSFLFQDSKKI